MNLPVDVPLGAIDVITDRDGDVFRIDTSDLVAVSRYPWRIDSRGYPSTTVGRRPYSRSVRLHVFLLGPAPAGMVWDHENRCQRDNRRANLRPATRRLNALNSKIRTNNKSGVPGVYWSASRRLWIAQHRYDGRTRALGGYGTVAEAAEVVASLRSELAARGIE